MKRHAVNVYMPPAMLEEMQAFPEINWSKLAQAAFRAELDRLGSRRKHVWEIGWRKGEQLLVFDALAGVSWTIPELDVGELGL